QQNCKIRYVNNAEICPIIKMPKSYVSLYHGRVPTLHSAGRFYDCAADSRKKVFEQTRIKIQCISNMSPSMPWSQPLRMPDA
ncbi:hypothetical protein L9F63_011595, partial [Diploptera punctata]